MFTILWLVSRTGTAIRNSEMKERKKERKDGGRKKESRKERQEGGKGGKEERLRPKT